MNPPSFAELIAKADAYVQEVAAREQEIAAAAEQLSQEPAVQAAFRDGVRHERSRVLTLISIQLDTLNRGGINALVLETHRRQVLEADR